MSKCALDPCLFFRWEGSKLAKLVGTLVDDTFSGGKKWTTSRERQKA